MAQLIAGQCLSEILWIDSNATTMSGITLRHSLSAPGPYQWRWTVRWRVPNRNNQFTQSGNFQSDSAWWTITSFDGALIGGIAEVFCCSADDRESGWEFAVCGRQPNAIAVRAFLATIPDTDGFDRIIEQESHFRHFRAEGVPIVSFDGGYGMCQLTNPVPTFEQVWNWKENVRAGAALFQRKVNAARAYLSQQGRPFTPDQLRREAVTRWNGGSYHRWNGNAWVRNPNIVCAPGTGNIGWDMTDPRNAGQTVQQLQQRDGNQFRRPRPANAPWIYSGVCYADHLLG